MFAARRTALDTARVANTHASLHRDRGLFVLAIFKMVKAVLFILAGIGVLSLLGAREAAEVREWLTEITVRQGHLLIQRALVLLKFATPGEITLVGFASLCYGLLFATEGIGLWLERRWAEYLTIFATGSLVPFEMYELVRRQTTIRTLALAANVLAVAYLVYRLRRPIGGRRVLR